MRIKADAFAQITIDDDYIIRDNKPDVLRVIYTRGDVMLEDARVGNGNVWITGKLQFKSLYQSDDSGFRLDSVLGEIPFQEKVVLDNAAEMTNISVDVSIEDLSVGIINSRKLMVRAVLNIAVKNMDEAMEYIAKPYPEDRHYQQKTKEIPMIEQVANKQDVVRVQRELLLPNSRTNIGSLLFYQVDFRNQENTLEEDCLKIQMDAQIMVLYRSESTGEYECYETVVPIAGEVEVPGVRGDEFFWAKITPIEITLEPREDYDGEARMLGLDIALSVKLQVYREDKSEILVDAYSLEKELQIERKPVVVQQLLMKNLSKVRLIEQVHLEPNQQRILQICGCSGRITVDRVQKQEEGIQMEGVLAVDVLYNTTDDESVYAHSSSQTPFEQFIEIPGLTENTDVWTEAQIEQLQVNLLDNTEYEIKAILQVCIMALDNQQIDNIANIEELPMDMDALTKQPGMIGYVRKEGEDLWDIAKKYHATAEDIIEIGDKVLVVKQVQ
ncbi:MAG: SPOCS domain-containing protein [Agathobacter sp.]